MFIRGTLLRAVRKVRWVRGPNGVPRLACHSCGTARGLGHDLWCRYIARPIRLLAVIALVSILCACTTKKCVEITYQTPEGTHTSLKRCFVTKDNDLVNRTPQASADCLAWLADQKRENVSDFKLTEE